MFVPVFSQALVKTTQELNQVDTAEVHCRDKRSALSRVVKLAEADMEKARREISVRPAPCWFP